MEKIFQKRNLKIGNWIVAILFLLLFEFGYANIDFTRNLLKGEMTIFYFSLCRGIVYLGILIAIFFWNRSKLIEEIAKTYEIKWKKVITIIYLIGAVLLEGYFIYQYLFLENALVLTRLAILTMAILGTGIAIIYLSNRFITNIIGIGVLASIFCVTMTDYHVLDEKKHFMSAYNVSYLHFDFQNPKVDTIFMDDLVIGTHFQNFTDFFKINYKYEQGSLPKEGAVSSTPATYHPILYLPSAIGLFVGRMLRGSVADIFLLGRIFNLIAFLGMMAITFKLLPFKKNLFYAVLTLPMVLSLAATYSVDGIGIGFITIFVAYCFKLYKEKEQVTFKKLIILMLLFTLSLTYKMLSYGFVGLLIFLLPIKQIWKNTKKTKIIALIIGFFILVFGILATQPKVNLTDDRYENVNATEQIKYGLQHPMLVPEVLKQHLLNTAFNLEWIKDFIPHDILSVKASQALLFLLAYLFYVAILEDGKHFNKKEKFILILAFFLTYAFTSGILYVACSPIGANYVMGYQLRYIFPILGLLLATFSNKNIKLVSEENHVLKMSNIPILFTFLCVIGTILK